LTKLFVIPPSVLSSDLPTWVRACADGETGVVIGRGFSLSCRAISELDCSLETVAARWENLWVDSTPRFEQVKQIAMHVLVSSDREGEKFLGYRAGCNMYRLHLVTMGTRP
jgi:hypothetical protein